jgi:phosphatidylglycerol:prolipoprotein diacylglycerol transferase
MFPAIQIGPVAIQSPGLFIILGFVLGISLSEYFTKKKKENPDLYTNLLLIVPVTYILGGRIVYVIANISAFQHNLSGIISLDSGLVDPLGGFASAFIASLIYYYRKTMKLWIVLDRLTPFFATFLIFLGLAHIASGHAFGAPASIPWAIYLWGTMRHPSQIYETISAVFIFIIFWKQFNNNGDPGQLFLKFLALTSCSAVFLSAFRGDSPLIFGSFRSDQLIALSILAAALFLLELKYRKILHSNSA